MKPFLWGVAIGLLPGYMWGGWLADEAKTAILKRDAKYHKQCDELNEAISAALKERESALPKKALRLEFAAGRARYRLECKDDQESECTLEGVSKPPVKTDK